MPWRGYRGEWLVIVLVAVGALSFFYANSQDDSRFGLTQALYQDGSSRIDRFVTPDTVDKSVFDGHYYSDKAPGLAIAALPTLGALDAAGKLGPHESKVGVWSTDSLAWVLRVFTSGLAFVVLVWLLGRVSEGLAEGTGAATAVSFGLGTLTIQLAATSFGHVAAGTLGFAAFVLAWTGLARHAMWVVAAGGLSAGLAVAVEYQLAVVAALVLGYVAWRARGTLAPLLFAGGAAPALVALGAYQWAAFGSPLRTPYRYIDNGYTELQQTGFFGIVAPDADNAYRIVLTRHGLLTTSPVLVAAAVGLGLLWRTGRRAEAFVCALTSLAFFFLEAGYFDPYGGASPGPRFFAPALPFLLLGLPLAFARWPRLTGAAAVFSVAAMTLDAATMTFSLGNLDGVELTRTIWSIAGAPVDLGLAVPVTATVMAVLLAAWNLVDVRPSAAEARLSPARSASH
jgi:hypothetical protein